MMDEKSRRELAANDPDYRTGAVEDGKKDMIDKQVLPVWASTEPFGYEGSPADAQAVGGQPEGDTDPGKAHSRRDVIGPGAD